MCVFVGRIVTSELWPGAVIGVHRLAQRDHAKINRARCWLFIYTGNNAIIDEPVDLEPCLESLFFLVFVWINPQFQCLLRFHWRLLYHHGAVLESDIPPSRLSLRPFLSRKRKRRRGLWCCFWFDGVVFLFSAARWPW